jgi:hypothetical protein
MSTAGMTDVDAARDALRASREAITTMEGRLGDLRQERRHVAIAGGDTRAIRGAISGLEDDLLDAQMQESELVRVLAGLEGDALHQERLSAVLGVYEKDLRVLVAERAVLGAQAEVAAATEALKELTGGQPWGSVRARGADLLRLGIGTDLDLPVVLKPLRCDARSLVGLQTAEGLDLSIEAMRRNIADVTAEIQAGATGDIDAEER